MNASTVARAAVLGASGFAGAELLRLAAGHPNLDIVFGSGERHAGAHVGDIYPNLATEYRSLTLRPWEEVPDDVDVVFIALPHGVSQSVVPKLPEALVIDLGGDFRFNEVEVYEKWYGREHAAPELNEGFTYGLVELFRPHVKGAKSIAVPGCYATTATLTIAPFLAGGLAKSKGIVVDAASGVSGAGSDPKSATSFAAVAETFTAYGLLNHRHTPEMEMALGSHSGGDVELLFTPHLAPMSRGILATCYLRPTGSETSKDLLDQMSDFYEGEPFVVVSERIPTTKATTGSNSIHMTVRKDERTGWIVAIGALDNLIKGAAGQAIQCLNVVRGLPETAGLVKAGIYP